jgi:hypothetical protein
LRAFCAIVTYVSPAAVCGISAWILFDGEFTAAVLVLVGLAVVLLSLAVYSLPGGMTYNAVFDDIRYLYRPDRAFLRAVEGGWDYLRAWVIAISAIALSSLGVLAIGIGFAFTSVWAWSVVGYAFSMTLAFTKRSERLKP